MKLPAWEYLVDAIILAIAVVALSVQLAHGADWMACEDDMAIDVPDAAIWRPVPDVVPGSPWGPGWLCSPDVSIVCNGCTYRGVGGWICGFDEYGCRHGYLRELAEEGDHLR